MKMSSGTMLSTKDKRIQISSEWSCNGKYPGFSRGNLLSLLFMDPRIREDDIVELVRAYPVFLLSLAGQSDPDKKLLVLVNIPGSAGNNTLIPLVSGFTNGPQANPFSKSSA